MSSALVKLGDDIWIDATQTAETLEEAKKTFKSVLYLAQDIGEDSGIAGGFETIKKDFPGAAKMIPFNHSAPPYCGDQCDPLQAVQAFGTYEAALDSLPRPTLVICKSSTRAGAVVAPYLAAKQGQSADECIKKSAELGLLYANKPPLARWVETAVAGMTHRPLIFRQLFEKESSTYTYILACPETKEAIIIDPVVETADRDEKIIKEMGLNLLYAINTHCHADHITGTWELKKKFPNMRTQIAKAAGAQADLFFAHGDRIQFGNRFITVLATPGHTSGCCTFLQDDFYRVFTGDAVLVRGCGRTDFQAGNSSQLYDVIWEQIFSLPGSCNIYPAHDYKGFTSSTVQEERTLNPRLTKTKAEFIDIMANLNLPYPKQIDRALPANLKCGCQD